MSVVRRTSCSADRLPGRSAGLDPCRRPPRRVPTVGQVLSLAEKEVRYRKSPLRLRVARVRTDISGWYSGEWVWLEGHELDAGGYPIGWQQLLVAVGAIERQDGSADAE